MSGAIEQRSAISLLAGRPAPEEILVDLACLERDYYARRPALEDPNQLVSFGTSGHRGSPLRGTFTEAHILAITQAICDYRSMQGTDGPLYMGKDTHALSGPAQLTALEVLAANGVEVLIQRNDGATPTPVISRAILVHNHNRSEHLADGIVTRVPGNNAPIGGLKVVASSGWFAARPSGTENVFKIYAESLRDEAHLYAIVAEAREMVNRALAS